MAKEKPEALVLVGFGKRDLVDLISKINTSEEEELLMAPVQSPPRFRRESICTPEQIEAFIIYGRWAQEKLLRGEI